MSDLCACGHPSRLHDPDLCEGFIMDRSGSSRACKCIAFKNKDTEIADLRLALRASEERCRMLEGLLRRFVDDDPCEFDHHGYCQTHGDFTGAGACRMNDAHSALAPPMEGKP